MKYLWACKDTGKMVEVDRSISEYNEPPTLVECMANGWTFDEFDKVKDWIKIITGGSFHKGFGKKGYW